MFDSSSLGSSMHVFIDGSLLRLVKERLTASQGASDSNPVDLDVNNPSWKFMIGDVWRHDGAGQSPTQLVRFRKVLLAIFDEDIPDVIAWST